ncbi:MAG: hypothetical protein WCH04_00330 [Gammaproteobacteria bacterium]
MIEGIFRNSVVLVLIIQIASGCTSLRPLPDERNVLEQVVKPGDKVHVITRDGQEMEFLVKQIANERIEGPRQGVAMDDIAKIERREFSVWKTATLIVLLIFAAAGGIGAPAGS